LELPRTSFPHHRLDAYRVAVELLLAARIAADGVPRGYRKFSDQLLRAAGAVVGATCEGANRHTAALKRDAFGRGRAEAGEAAGWAEALALAGLCEPEKACEIIQLADRCGAMLTRLMETSKGVRR
jgi:four helix bundle protein